MKITLKQETLNFFSAQQSRTVGGLFWKRACRCERSRSHLLGWSSPWSWAPRDIGSHAAGNIQIRFRAHAGLAAVYRAQQQQFWSAQWPTASCQRPVVSDERAGPEY